MLEIIIFLIFVVGLIAVIVLFCRSFYAGRAKRQQNVEEQRKRNGGEYILEWSGPVAQGEPDSEFEELIVEIFQKRGTGSARFYKKGLVIGQKRFPYSEIKDVVFAGGTPGKKLTIKAAVRDSAVMWIYPKKGAAFSLSALTYTFNDQTMEDIKKGLGF